MKKLIITLLVFAGIASAQVTNDSRGVIYDNGTNNITILDGAITLDSKPALTATSGDGELEYTTTEINDSVANEVNQWGASGYLSNAPVTNTPAAADTWHAFTNCTFTIPYASGFTFVTNSTVSYTNGPRWFNFEGHVSATGAAVDKWFEFGVMTNGVYVTGSSSGPCKSAAPTDAGGISYSCPVLATNGMQIGLCYKNITDTTEVRVQAWTSSAQRF